MGGVPQRANSLIWLAFWIEMPNWGDGYRVPIATGKTGVGVNVGVGVGVGVGLSVKVGNIDAVIPVGLPATAVWFGLAFGLGEAEHELRKNKPRTREIVMVFIFAPFRWKTLHQLTSVIRVPEYPNHLFGNSAQRRIIIQYIDFLEGKIINRIKPMGETLFHTLDITWSWKLIEFVKRVR